MEQVLDLQLFGLGDVPPVANLRWGLPHIGDSPRHSGPLSDVQAEDPNIDASWVRQRPQPE